MINMEKKKGLKVNIHFSNRWLYTFIFLGILISIGVVVYALTPGVAPNPGHFITELAPPTGCNSNQFLKFDGINWVCATISTPETPDVPIDVIISTETDQGHFGADWCLKKFGASWHVCAISELDTAKSCLEYTASDRTIKNCVDGVMAWESGVRDFSGGHIPYNNPCNNWASALITVSAPVMEWDSVTGTFTNVFIFSCNNAYRVACCR